MERAPLRPVVRPQIVVPSGSRMWRLERRNASAMAGPCGPATANFGDKAHAVCEALAAGLFLDQPPQKLDFLGQLRVVLDQ